MLASESKRRTVAYLHTGCNAYRSRKPRSMPLGFWTGQDVLRYIKETGIPYAKDIYGEIVEDKEGASLHHDGTAHRLLCLPAGTVYAPEEGHGVSL